MGSLFAWWATTPHWEAGRCVSVEIWSCNLHAWHAWQAGGCTHARASARFSRQAGLQPACPICHSLRQPLVLQTPLICLLSRSQVHKGAGMAWEEGHFWSAEVAVPPGTDLEFKVGAAW